MDLVVLSEVKWKYMRTRKRFLITHFPRDWRILFLEPISAAVQNNFWPRRDGNVLYMSTPVLKPHTESRLYNRLVRLSAVRGLMGVLAVLWVRTAMLLLGVRADVRVLVSNVYFAPVVENLRRSFVCYDCNDDPTVFPNVPEWSVHSFRRLCRRADVIVACSESLGERVHSVCGKRPLVIGNGVDYELFSREVTAEQVPADIRGLKKPVVGYTGAIKEWFDFELVQQAALACPDASFALIGPVAPGAKAEAETLSRACSNVHFLGEKPYESLPLYLSATAVCLIPFKLGPLTTVLNPNKLYEYLAAGKTVVSLDYSQDMAELRDFMYLVKESSQFAETVKVALSQPLDSGGLKRVARENSWARRSAELVAVLEAGRHAPLGP